MPEYEDKVQYSFFELDKNRLLLRVSFEDDATRSLQTVNGYDFDAISIDLRKLEESEEKLMDRFDYMTAEDISEIILDLESINRYRKVEKLRQKKQLKKAKQKSLEAAVR